MTPDPVQLSIRVDARSKVQLRPGDFVFLEVIKRLADGKWAVRIEGKALTARSELPLYPGQRLRAQVAASPGRLAQGRLVLRLSETPADPVQSLLRQQGLKQDAVAAEIAGALLRGGVPARSETVQQARRLLAKTRLDPKRAARLVALAAEKKLDLGSPGLAAVIETLSYGDQERGRRRYRGRQMPGEAPELAGTLRAVVEQAQPSEDNALQLFNHLKGEQAAWVIVPYDFTYPPSGRIYGTIRLRFDPSRRRTDRVVLSARSEGKPALSFLLHRGGDGDRLQVVSSDRKATQKARAEFAELRRKLQNLGVKVDDTIHKDDVFDGFSLSEEEPFYRSIDTLR
jgi:hypothetical protein